MSYIYRNFRHTAYLEVRNKFSAYNYQLLSVFTLAITRCAFNQLNISSVLYFKYIMRCNKDTEIHAKGMHKPVNNYLWKCNYGIGKALNIPKFSIGYVKLHY